MKYLNLLLMISLINISCREDTSIPNGYVKYQTFNEYILKGVPGNSDNLKSPYVLVKEDIDTIFVIRSSCEDKVLESVNMRDFWYSMQTFEEFDEHIDIYSEIFISNGTILTCNYNRERKDGKEYNIIIENEKEKIVIWHMKMAYSNKKELYAKLLWLASRYKDEIPLFSRDEFLKAPDRYPTCYYNSYIKIFKGDKLYVFDNRGANGGVCLSDVFQLNSLREFDRSRP